MATNPRQCGVYRNPSKQTRSRVPFLLVVQADFLSALESRTVVPLVDEKFMRLPLSRLHPRFTVDGKTVVMATADLAAVPARIMTDEVADLSAQRGVIIAAIDYLLTGA